MAGTLGTTPKVARPRCEPCARCSIPHAPGGTTCCRCGAPSGTAACRAPRHRRASTTHLAPLLAQHASAFAAPQALDGWALRRQLQLRLVLLLRRTLVEPVTAFVYLALSALECERLRGELVRRAAFPRSGVAP